MGEGGGTEGGTVLEIYSDASLQLFSLIGRECHFSGVKILFRIFWGMTCEDDYLVFVILDNKKF